MSPIAFSARPTVLRCGRCGRFMDWAEGRLQVVCGCRPHIDLPPVLTREAAPGERQGVLDLFQQDFGRTRIATFGDVVDLAAVDMIVAEMSGSVAGALAWRQVGDALHVIALATDPMWQRSGVGGHLLAEAEAQARRAGLQRLLVTATNDNLPALYFYQRHGYRIIEIVRDAMAAHPGMRPLPGFADIPALDELRLEKRI